MFMIEWNFSVFEINWLYKHIALNKIVIHI